MRVFVSVDMEGIAGVTGRDEVIKGHGDYERFRKIMTEEANAAVEGAFDGGASSVVVNDSHNGMRNILYEALDERAELISGYNKPLGMVQGVEGTDAAVFIGYHAWAGTSMAVMDHTISGMHTYNWFLNGQRIAEAHLNAAICGHFGVPVVLVSGDDKLEKQVQESLPGTKTVVVKESIHTLAARSLPRPRVHALIREGVGQALKEKGKIRPIKTDGPIRIRIQFTRAGFAEGALLLPEAKRIDDRTVEVRGRDILEAWRRADVALRLATTAND